MIKEPAILKIPITRVVGNVSCDASDTLAIEEPLEISLGYGQRISRLRKNISVTMRTPGDDAELALGFLFTEGIISRKSELATIAYQIKSCSSNQQNSIQVELADGLFPELQHLERNFYTTSSCGVCGKGSIESIKTTSIFNINQNNTLLIDQQLLIDLPVKLRAHQRVFEATGGLHACALFSAEGELIQVREDVGRHNALDKLIGFALNTDLLPLDKSILLLSGRASFELVQKAAMAGISIIAAVGAPSSLAVQLANEFGITLIGFLRESRFNIYTMPNRIQISPYEN